MTGGSYLAQSRTSVTEEGPVGQHCRRAGPREDWTPVPFYFDICFCEQFPSISMFDWIASSFVVSVILEWMFCVSYWDTPQPVLLCKYFDVFINQPQVKFLAFGVTANWIGIPCYRNSGAQLASTSCSQRGFFQFCFSKSPLSFLFLFVNWSLPKEMNLIADCWRLITYDMPKPLHKCQCWGIP